MYVHVSVRIHVVYMYVYMYELYARVIRVAQNKVPIHSASWLVITINHKLRRRHQKLIINYHNNIRKKGNITAVKTKGVVGLKWL